MKNVTKNLCTAMNITTPMLESARLCWAFNVFSSVLGDGSPKQFMIDLHTALLAQRSSAALNQGPLVIALGRSCLLMCLPLLIPRMQLSTNRATGYLGTFDGIPVVFDAHLPDAVIPTTHVRLLRLTTPDEVAHEQPTQPV